jgi:pantetheine-phosphate adenylyltransferase
MRTAIYPGSFDPPTLAHQNILEQASRLFDVLVIVANNATKSSSDVSSRLEWVVDGLGHNEAISTPADESIVETAKNVDAEFIIRGIRGPADFEPEAAFAHFVRTASQDKIQVVYFMTPPALQHVSSTLVRSVLKLKGRWELAAPYLPPRVLEVMQGHYRV